MNKKIFISIPMRGRKDEEVKAEMQKIMKNNFPDDILLDTVVDSGNPIECIGNSIQLMGKADLIVFAPGWSTARGCLVEKYIADRYDKSNYCIFLEDYKKNNDIRDVGNLCDELVKYPVDWSTYVGNCGILKINDFAFMSSIEISDVNH